MKKIIAFITVFVFAVCSLAVVSFSEGDYVYSLDATYKQFDQGQTATLKLELKKGSSNFDYCGVNATVAVPFDISDVSYTVPGKTAVSVTADKLDPEAETSSSNPYTFVIDFAPEFSVESGAAETAKGDITISFKISDEAKTGYKDVSITGITVYIDETIEDTTSEETSSEETSSEETSSEETSSEEVTSEASEEATLEVYNAGHAKTDVEITPKSSSNVNGDGATLTIKILDKNAQNAKLSGIKVGVIAEETEEGIVFEKEFALSPEFSSDTASYSVTVDAETTSFNIIPETVFSGADISYEASSGVTVSDGLVTLGSGNTCRITITITSEQRKQKYYININRGTTSDVTPDETSSDETSDISSDESTDVSSNSGAGTTSTPEASDVSSDADVITNLNGGDGTVSTGMLILIIIISFACGFVLCLILVKTGAIPMGDGPKDKKPVNRSADDDTFIAGASSGSDSGYTATRVMPIPGGNSGKKFEINIDYDEPTAEKVENAEKTVEKKEEKEQKAKKQSFFFDDDEF